MRCEKRVTHRNPYKLPPNTWEEQCKFEAVEKHAGQNLCQRHIDQWDRELARARQKQERRRRQELLKNRKKK